jgi:ubiquinone/menaquinone biosynthesis C-methylase UbiE
MSKMTTDNLRKHTHQNPIQKFLIERFFTSFIEEIRLAAPKSILDVGCGEGFTLERLRKQKIGEKLEGVDFLKTAIEIGRKLHPKVTLKEGTIYALPYKANSFDLVICSEVLEHLEHPDKALEELHRVTKKYVALSVPNEPTFMVSNFLRGKNWSRWGNDIEHINHWSTRKFSKFVSKEFDLVTVDRSFPWTIIIAKKRN